MATVKQIREWLATKPDDYVFESKQGDLDDWTAVDADHDHGINYLGKPYHHISAVLRVVPPGTHSNNQIPGSEYVQPEDSA